MRNPAVVNPPILHFILPTSFTFYTTDQGLPSSRVYGLVEDSAGRIWAATVGGVTCFDGKQMRTYTTEHGLGANAVWCALKDKKENLWFGTFGGGVSRFTPDPKDPGRFSVTTFNTDNGLVSNSVKSIAEDGHNNIWVGTGGGGISRFDGKTFLNYSTLDGLSNNIVVATGVDKAGNAWFGTNEGVNLLKGFRPATVAVNDSAKRLVPAVNGMSNNELARGYKPVFEQFNYKGGFPIKDINTNAFYIDSSGLVWAGTADKLISFDRTKLYKRVEIPYVFIDGLRVGGEKISWNTLLNYSKLKQQKVIPAGDSLAMINEELLTLDNLTNNAQRDTMFARFGDILFDSVSSFFPLPQNLVLPYKHNSITIDFAATELTRPFMVRYQYMLEGYDNGWAPVTERNSVSYGNIPEGTYNFLLRAQSPDGVWCQPVKYTFTVQPPAYRTWWAYLLYFGVFICFVYIVVHYRTDILKRENSRLETIVSERTAQIELEKAAVLKQAEELRKLNAFKDKTFSVLSHDLRGPIATSAMVISLLDEDLTEEEFITMRDGVVKQLEATESLLDNLLKWAKSSMEGSIKVHPARVKVADIAAQTAALFGENLRMKHISLELQITVDAIAHCDPEHLDIVLRNLVANAIKFTPTNGTIKVTTRQIDAEMHISVIDTGVGMTQEQVDRLFKPAIINTTFGTEGEKGTGLGLLLSYEFVKANNGRINVTSTPGYGTTFTIVLPA